MVLNADVVPSSLVILQHYSATATSTSWTPQTTGIIVNGSPKGDQLLLSKFFLKMVVQSAEAGGVSKAGHVYVDEKAFV